MLNLQFRNLNTYFTLGNFLFGSVELTKNADLDKIKYTGYIVRFGSCSSFICRCKLWKKCHYFWS